MYNIVERMLEESENSRNSDTHLIFRVLRYMGFNVEWTNKEIIFKVEHQALYNLPSFATIVRCRRKIQNDEGRLLPTRIDVITARRIQEEKVRSWFSKHSPEILGKYNKFIYGTDQLTLK